MIYYTETLKYLLFCYFNVCGSHAGHGIYIIFHGNTRVSRVLPEL